MTATLNIAVRMPMEIFVGIGIRGYCLQRKLHHAFVANEMPDARTDIISRPLSTSMVAHTEFIATNALETVPPKICSLKKARK